MIRNKKLKLDLSLKLKEGFAFLLFMEKREEGKGRKTYKKGEAI